MQMRTPKEYTDNLKKKTITESMLLDCLYSVNKRAKNYRDKERGYRQYYRGNRYAYDKYGNVDRCQVMKEEYYSQKKKIFLSTTWKSLRSISFKQKAMKSQSWFPHSL